MKKEQRFLLDNDCDDLILNDRKGTKPEDRIYASHIMNLFHQMKSAEAAEGENTIHNMAACMLSILDSLKLYDKDSLLLDEETLSEVMFRKMRGYGVDLNDILGYDHLKPVPYKKDEK